MAADPFHELIHNQRGELLSEMPPARVVLSAGCSGSWYFQWLDQKYPSRIERHIGFDLDPPPDELPPNVEYYQHSFCDLSGIPDASVDLIFAGQAIEHVSAAESFSFFRHAHRVLKSDGWLVMDSPNFTITDPWPYVNPDHIIEYKPRQMRSILDAAGFEVVNSKGILLCKENGKVIHEPYEYARIDQRRSKEAKGRPEDSFIWWMEARKARKFNGSRLAKLLDRTNRSYERQLARTAARRAKEQRKVSQRELRLSRRPSATLRQAIRRLVPYRLRWLIKVTFKRVAGLYFRDLMSVLADVRDRVDGLQKTLGDVQTRLDAQEEVMSLFLRRIRALEDEFADVRRPLEATDEAQRSLQALLVRRLDEIDLWVRRIGPSPLSSTIFLTPSSEQEGDDELVVTSDLSDFYMRFQDRHRGSEEIIRQRQQKRVTYFSSCRQVLDIGCGRGEFLELLREAKIAAKGIDLSDAAVESCRRKGLAASQADAFDFLANTETGTFDGIHMSHVLEHMPFQTVVRLLETCAAHLPAGGVLVAETPNPHSPEALHAFFLDPTHVRPLFPETLTILLESLHFVALKTYFLNPQPRQTEDSERRPQDFADYLLVAIKDGDLEPQTSNDKQPGRLGQPHKPAPTAPPSA